MSAQQFNLLIEQGSDFTLEIPVLGAGNLPLSVTGWTAAGQIRAEYRAATVLYQITPVVANTTVVVHIPAATSAAWPWRAGHYDVELTDPSGNVIRLVEGVVVVRPEVTR